MPTIDQLAPATAASDTDEILVSQNGTARKITRAQVLAGVQPEIALASGVLLGRASSGTGAPEPLTIGANLQLSGSTLSATAQPYSVAALPSGIVPVATDLVPLGQGGANTAIPYARFMSGVSGVPNLDASKMLVTPTGAGTGATLADFAAGTMRLTGGTMTGAIVLAADPAVALQPATKQYVDAISNVTATGTSTARTLANRFSDTLNLLDFVLPGDTDATAGVNRAVARALAIGHPVEIFIPAGNYSLSGTISITTAASQGVHIRGAGASRVTITQTADADAFDVSLTNFGGIFGTGAFSVSGITLKMGAASTTRTALSVSSTALSGAQGVPLVLDDITLISTSGTSLWGTGISLFPFNGPAYLTRINSTYGLQTSAGTAIALSGNSSTYTTNVYLSDVLFIAGNVGLSLGNYLQGIQIHNLNTINTLYSIYSAPTLGGNEEIKISDSYLDGKFYFSASNPNTLDAVKVINTYFDSDTLVASDNHVTFNNVSVLTLVGNTFNGKGGAISGVTGLYINGTSLFETTLLGNTIQSYGVTGGVGIKFSATTSNIMAIGTQFINNVTDISDAGTNNILSSTNKSGTFYLYGTPGDVPTAPASVYGGMSVSGGNLNVNGAANNLAIYGNTTGNAPAIQAFGSDTNINLDIVAKGAGGIFALSPLSANAGLGVSGGALNVVGTANNIGMGGATTGNAPIIQTFGADTNINLALVAKGSGSVGVNSFLSANAGLGVSGGNLNVSGAANNLALAGATTGNAPVIQSFGSDTNIGLTLMAKGAGSIKATSPLSLGNVGINAAIQYVASAGPVTIGAGISQLFFHSGTTLASAAITMPAAPTNASTSIQDLVVTTDVAITSVTWVLGAGTQIFLGAALPSTLPAGGEVRFKWYQALNAWVHVVPQ